MKIAIIGAGPGGLCMGIRLKQAGFNDFVILEKGQGVGGTWYHNRYPGCAVDLPSYLYSFSFEKKYDWTRPYAPQPELLAYMEGIAEKYDLLGHCRFDSEVTRAAWQEDTASWQIDLATGDTFDANVVVSAVGMFNDLTYPDLKGLSDFEGSCFHSARWDWNVPLEGQRIGVVGSAASAVQIVPELVDVANVLDNTQVATHALEEAGVKLCRPMARSCISSALWQQTASAFSRMGACTWSYTALLV